MKIESGKTYRRMDGSLITAGEPVVPLTMFTDPYIALEKALEEKCLQHGYSTIPKSETILREISDLERQDVDCDNLETLYLMVYYYEKRENSNYPRMEVGKRYRMFWDDGGTCDYTVTAINEDHVAIRWDNGAENRFQYTSGIHEKSKPIE